MRTSAKRNAKKIELMEKSFECYCENGLSNTGIKALADACDMTAPNFYSYFDNLDQLIIECTEHCMIKIEKEIMDQTPKTPEGFNQFIEIMPEWVAENYAKAYRFMYQVHTTPKYLEYGKKFQADAMIRYAEYAKQLAPVMGMPWQVLRPLIIVFANAVIHYALFEDEVFLSSQRILLKNVAVNVKKKYEGVDCLEADLPVPEVYFK